VAARQCNIVAGQHLRRGAAERPQRGGRCGVMRKEKIEELWCGGHAEQMIGRSEFVKKTRSL
jgi:hypothetical protein